MERTYSFRVWWPRPEARPELARGERDGVLLLLPGMGLAAPVPSLDALASRLLAEPGEGPVVLIGHSQSCQWKDPVPLTARKLAASLWTGPHRSSPPVRRGSRR